MKKLCIYIFLVLFSFQTPSQADDIKEFQIEGMSIGDSALDYFTKEQIKNAEFKIESESALSMRGQTSPNKISQILTSPPGLWYISKVQNFLCSAKGGLQGDMRAP